MSVVSRDELLGKIKTIVGDSTDESTLSFLEDFTDTFDSMKQGDLSATISEYEAKLKEIDEAWSARYKERFFNSTGDYVEPAPAGQVTPVPENETNNTAEVTGENITIDDLFDTVD